MDSYLNEIARYPLMTPEEEIRLGKLVQQMVKLKQLDRELTPEEKQLVRRGERAKRRFVEANLRLVVYIAKRYAARQPINMDILDLVQEGSVGLMRAVEMYDPNRGYKFSTYSYWWCRQAMSRALQVQERLIRRPHTVIDLAGKLPKALTEESQRLGRTPTTKELAAKLKVKAEEIELLIERGRAVLSLDSVTKNNDDKSIIEVIADPSSLTRELADDALELELKTPVLQLGLSTLTEQERTYIEMRYGLNGYSEHTYEAISKETNAKVSRERIRQILDRAVTKLRFQMAQIQAQQAEDRRNEAQALMAKEQAPPPVQQAPWNVFASAAETPVSSPALRCA